MSLLFICLLNHVENNSFSDCDLQKGVNSGILSLKPGVLQCAHEDEDSEQWHSLLEGDSISLFLEHLGKNGPSADFNHLDYREGGEYAMTEFFSH